MEVSFQSIASSEWLVAERLSGLILGMGRQEGREVVFENPFERDGKRHSFRFLVDHQVFMDHHQLASDMRVTPASFLAKALRISTSEAWKQLKVQSGQWIHNRAIYRSASVLKKLGFGSGLGEYDGKLVTQPESSSKPEVGRLNPEVVGLEQLFGNQDYCRILQLRTVLFRALMNKVEVGGNGVHPDAIQWLRSRGFVFQDYSEMLPDCIPLSREPVSQLYSLSEKLGWSNEERLLSGLWRRADRGGLQTNWIGHEYTVLFPIWSPIRSGFSCAYWVTGVRARKTSDCSRGPKEVVLNSRGLDGSHKFPSSLGWSGLFRHSRGFERSPPQAVLAGCDGLTVVLTEGITDAIAGVQLLSLESHPEHASRVSQVLFVSTGQIQTSSLASNLSLLGKCRRLIIAFNDDSTAAKNTGQFNATRLREVALNQGFLWVDILPVECLEGCNDLNDLLRKRRKEIASGAPRGFLEFRNFSTFIGVNNDRK
jgi:hypothetical protein